MTPSRWTPAVPKCWLFFVSGVLWSCVGVAMCTTAAGWLAPISAPDRVGTLLAGAVLAVLANRRGFGPIARKNIRRLRRLPGRRCLFAFQAWKSYGLILAMVALGGILRHLPVSRNFLAVVYLAIGGALLLGSVPYYRHLARLRRVARRRRVIKPAAGVGR